MDAVDDMKIRFIKEISVGNNSKIFLVDSSEHGILVAKSIPDHGEDFNEMLEKEALIMSKLNNPNVIRFYGFYTSDTEKWILMENAEYGSLFTYMRSLKNFEKEFPWSIRYQMAIGIARGLKYLHNHNIIHRDLKSANVLISKTLEPKICDFGISNILSPLFENSINTYGTYNYAAPEAFSMEQTIKSDIFSLGHILWELATGKMPFEGVSFSIVQNCVCNKKERPIIPKNCPKDFAEIIMKCWSHTPEERPSAAEIFKQLSIIASDKKIVNSHIPNQPIIVKQINPDVRFSEKADEKPDSFEENIFIATFEGKLDSIIYLMNHGTSLDMIYKEDVFEGSYVKGSTLLHFAAKYGHLTIVQFLINNELNVNSENDDVNFLILN